MASDHNDGRGETSGEICGCTPPVIWLQASLAALDDNEDLAVTEPWNDRRRSLEKFLEVHRRGHRMVPEADPCQNYDASIEWITGDYPGRVEPIYQALLAVKSLAARALVAGAVNASTGDDEDSPELARERARSWVAQERAEYEEHLRVTLLGERNP